MHESSAAIPKATDSSTVENPVDGPESVITVRRVFLLVVLAAVVLVCFAALGAAVATPLFGLICGSLTIGLVGLGWVML